MKAWKKLFHENTNQKLAEVAILLLDKIDFKSKRYKRQMKTLYINKRFSTSIRFTIILMHLIMDHQNIWGKNWQNGGETFSTIIVRDNNVVAFQLLSHVWLFATSWTAACQAILSSAISWILLKFMSIESVIPSNHLILCLPLLLLPSILPIIRVFSNELAHCHQVAKDI